MNRTGSISRVKRLAAGTILCLCLAALVVVLMSVTRGHQGKGQRDDPDRVTGLGVSLQRLGYRVRTDTDAGDCTVVLPVSATHAELRRAGIAVEHFMTATYTDPTAEPVMGVFIRRDGMFDPIAVVGNLSSGPRGEALSWQLVDHSHLSP